MTLHRGIAAAVALLALLASSACGSDDEGGAEPTDEPEAAETSEAPAAPDGTYASATDADGQQVTLEVEDQAITRIQADLVLECAGATAEVDSQLSIEIGEDGAVDYVDDRSTDLAIASTSLVGTFEAGTFEGTYTYDHPTEMCGTAEVDFTAEVA